MTRTAISPRLAIRILVSTSANLGFMDTPDATWLITIVDETGSTNVDLLAAAAAGAAGSQRADGPSPDRWPRAAGSSVDAPAGANLLVSMLFREVPAHPHELTQRVALAAAQACREIAGVTPTAEVAERSVARRAQARRRARPGRRQRGDGRRTSSSASASMSAGRPTARPGWAMASIRPMCSTRMLVAYDRSAGRHRRAVPGVTGRRSGNRSASSSPGSAVIGRAFDVMPDGRLVVLDECGITHRFDTGDVVHL